VHSTQITALLIYEDRALGQTVSSLLETTLGYKVTSIASVAPQLPKAASEAKADAVIFLARSAGLATVSAAQKVANECEMPLILVMPTDGMSRYGDRENLYSLTYAAAKPPEELVRDINTKLHVVLAGFRSRAVRTQLAGEQQSAGLVKGQGLDASSVQSSLQTPQKLIAIGASAGGTEAIYHVMVKLPGNLPGIVVVQHMPEGFTDMYAKRLDMNCAMKVVQASQGQKIERGWAYIAPGGKQLQVKRNADGYYIHLYEGERVSGHMPSVDVMFDSVAKCAGKHALGIILTGMGSDGAKGLLSLRQTGAHTLGQNEQTCLVYGMPRVAFELGGVAEQVALDEVSTKILQYADRKPL